MQSSWASCFVWVYFGSHRSNFGFVCEIDSYLKGREVRLAWCFFFLLGYTALIRDHLSTAPIALSFFTFDHLLYQRQAYHTIAKPALLAQPRLLQSHSEPPRLATIE